MDLGILTNIAGSLITAMPDRPKLKTTAQEVLNYADAFGYMEGIDWRDGKISPGEVEEVQDRIKKLQYVLGVDEDGIPETQTLKAIETVARCANRDYGFAREAINRWAREQANNLTWCIVDYITGVPPEVQNQLMAGAWAAWEAACDITLIPVKNPNQANILISASNDAREEFGRPGNVLAWAELPRGGAFKGRLVTKFDLSERWALETSQDGILLFNVACHEFGHLLGLDHTMIKGELMFPTYDRKLSLPQDRYDKPEVVNRYGARTTAPPPPPVDNPFKDWLLRNRVTGREVNIGA